MSNTQTAERIESDIIPLQRNIHTTRTINFLFSRGNLLNTMYADSFVFPHLPLYSSLSCLPLGFFFYVSLYFKLPDIFFRVSLPSSIDISEPACFSCPSKQLMLLYEKLCSQFCVMPPVIVGLFSKLFDNIR